MATSDQRPPARAAQDSPVTFPGRDQGTQDALARSRELRAHSQQLLARAQTIAPAPRRAHRRAGTGSGPRPGGQQLTATSDEQVEYARAARARLAALAAELADTEDRVARVHDRLAAEDPANAARYRRAADEARRAARRAREFQRNATAPPWIPSRP